MILISKLVAGTVPAAISLRESANGARLAIPALAIACAVSAVLASDTLVDFGGTSYSGASPAADAADALAGLGPALAGALAWMRSRTCPLGLVAMLAGLAWLAPDWVG